MAILSNEIKQSIRRSPLGPVAYKARAYTSSTFKRISDVVGEVSVTLGLPAKPGEPLPRQWKRIIRRSEEALQHLPPPTGPRIMFASGYGKSATKLAIESILAMGLRLRGAVPMGLLCDKALSACEFNRFGNFRPSPGAHGPQLGPRTQLANCQRCTQDIEDVYGPLSIPQTRLSQFSMPDDLARLTEIVSTIPYENYREYIYKDIQVGEHAFSSMLRATLRGTLIDDEQTRWLFHRYLFSTMHLVDLTERVFAAERPERIIAVHGVYLIHGTSCEVARKLGIPVVVFGVPYRQGTIWLSHSDTYHRTLVTEPTSLWDSQPLTPEQNRRLDTYLDSKRSGGRDYVNYHPNPVEDKQRIVSELDLDPLRPVISLYTNVIWDAQIYYDYKAFRNILEWVFATIQYFEKRPELQLVIRVHPAEVKGGLPTKQPLVPEVMARFPSLPENVRIVPPESGISSYTLAEMSHATLIYGTKMGLEIAIRGIPVVVAGETLCRRKGFTYDISSASEYFALLDRIETLPRNSPEMIERARRYAYYLFFRRMIDFPLFSVADPHRSTGLKLNFTHISQLAPGQDGALDAVCKGILAKSPFIYDMSQ